MPEKTPPRSRPWHIAALIGALLLAAFLRFYRLEQEGFGNLYYAAAVRSMSASWHNFFFVSFDPGGFVSVDKPPLGLWVQVWSAGLFGFDGWSLMLPQALSGVLSVALVFHLTRRVFGPTAGVIAALVMAVTPIAVAADRNNTMDSQLVLTSLLAAWAASRAAEKGRLRWLLLCALLVGLGFNIKMLQALLVLPAFVLLYLVAAPLVWWKQLVHLALAGALGLVVSLAWPVAVDLTPPDQRPYVGSSQDNTVMELILGHNGAARLGALGRLIGLSGQPGPRPDAPGQPGPRPDAPGQPPAGQDGPLPIGTPRPGGLGPPPFGGGPNQPPAGQGGPLPVGTPQPGQPPLGSGPANPPLSPGGDETGQAGALRLFNRQLAGQTSWLLPLVALGLIAVAAQVRLRWPLMLEHQSLLMWTAWLAPQLIFFSYAGLFHRYYLEMLAPAIAALAGAGFAAMWAGHHDRTWPGWLLPAALIVTAGVEAVILNAFPEWSRRLTPVVVGLAAVAAAALVVAQLLPAGKALPWAQAALACLGLLSLLVAPAVWSGTVLAGGNAALPFAGPELLGQPRRGASRLPDVSRLVSYLSAQRQGEKYLVATLNANTAAPVILATGEPVMALGGFSGNDRILSTEELAAKIAAGEARFLLLPQAQAGPRAPNAPPQVPLPGGPQSELSSWANARCRVVPPREWQSIQPGAGGAPPAGPTGPNAAQQLFDCAGM